jgi:hypothetical protein
MDLNPAHLEWLEHRINSYLANYKQGLILRLNSTQSGLSSLDAPTGNEELSHVLQHYRSNWKITWSLGAGRFPILCFISRPST